MACNRPTVKELIVRAGLRDESKLDQPCSDQDLRVIVKYCEQWRNIGPHLGLSKTQIEDIDQEKQTEEEKRSAMLATWKQFCAFNATFVVLVTVLHQCDCVDDAYNICQYLRDQENEAAPSGTGNNILQPHNIINKDIRSIQPQYDESFRSRRHTPEMRYTHIAWKKTTKEDLEAKFTHMMDEFGNSVCSVPLPSLHRSIAILPESARKDLRNPSEAIRSMIRTDSTVEFLAEFTIHSNYLNPSLLQYMVARLGSTRCTQTMSEYLKILQIYKDTTTIKEYINKQGDSRIEYREFIDILGHDWEDKTIEDLAQHIEKQHLCDSLLRPQR